MMGTMSAELAILLAWAMLWLESVNAFIFGDLKLFEPKTMCPLIAVRHREGR